MAENPLYAARLKEPLSSRVAEWQERQGVPKDSDAVRELMARGLDAEQSGGPTAHLAESVVLVLAVGAAVLAPLSVPFPALGPYALGYVVLAALVLAATLRARGARLRPLIARDRGRSA